MRIKEVSVKNFKMCPDGTYPLDKVNFLIAKNGRGKTSLQMAIRFLLNGALPNDAIREGEEFLNVSATVDDGNDTVIGREVYLPNSYQYNGKELSEKEFLKKAEPCKKECDVAGFQIHASPASNPWFFDKAPHVLWDFLLAGSTGGAIVTGVKELETVLADGTTLYVRKSKPSKCTVNGKKVTAKTLNQFLEDRMACNTKALDITTSSEVMSAMDMPDFAKYLISVIPVTMDFPKVAELSKLTDEEAAVLKEFFPKAPAAVSIGHVQAAYKNVFNIRTQLGRQMKEWEQRAKFDGQLPLPDPAEVQRKYAEASQAIGAATELQRAWDVYRKRLDERTKACETYKAWVEEYNKMGKAAPVPPEALQSLQQAETVFRGSIEQQQKNIARMQAGIEPLQAMLRNLETSVCPLCSTLVCKTDKTSCKADIERNIKQLEESVQKMQSELPDLQVQLENNRTQQEKVRDAADRLKRKAELYSKIMKLKESIPELPKEPGKVPPVDKLQKTAAHCQAYLRQISVYDESKKALEKYEETKRQYGLYCSLVSKTEPRKGVVTNTILDYLIAPFREHVNGFSKSIFSDSEISFGIGDNGLEVKCRPHGRASFLPVNSLSDGEKGLAVFALMDMVSSIAGTRILVFDRIEALDADAVSALLKTVSSEEVRERYDHIILASVDHPDVVAAAEAETVNIIKF